MRTLLAVLTLLAVFTGDALAQKPELTEVDAWLVRDAQMSSQFAVADALGYFKAEGIKVNPRWYIAGTDLPWLARRANILVDGLDLRYAVGAVLRLGDGVELLVTGELDPCRRMDAVAPGLRLALADDWRGGVTCRVRRGGWLRAGATARVEKSG